MEADELPAVKPALHIQPGLSRIFYTATGPFQGRATTATCRRLSPTPVTVLSISLHAWLTSAPTALAMPAHNAAPPQQPARAGPAVAPPWRRGSCPPSEGAHRPGGARGGGKEGQTGLAQKVGSETESAGRVAESTASTRWKRETEKEEGEGLHISTGGLPSLQD